MKPDQLVRAALTDLGRTLWAADPGARVRRPRWWRPILAPIGLLALVGIAAIGAQYLLDARDIGSPMAWSIAIVSAAPLLFVWHRPQVAWRIAFAGLLIGHVGARPAEPWPWHPMQIFIALFVVFMVALREPLGVILWTAALTGLATLAFARDDNAGGALVLVIAVMLLGEQIQRRRTAQRELHEQEERSELAEARRALLEERARIARELHDIVAHSLSLLAVRAETAPYRLAGLPEPARGEFTALAQTARESLGELRRLLGVLRTSGEPERVPQPSLSDLPELIESARSAGMRIDATVDIGPVAAATGLAAYRIVQEALSNAARHAAGAGVRVTVTLDGTLHLVVRNEPGTNRPVGGGTAGQVSAGHGLAGMRERAAVLGGTLTAGPTSDGGFAVEAELPLSPPRESV